VWALARREFGVERASEVVVEVAFGAGVEKTEEGSVGEVKRRPIRVRRARAAASS
jgi:hypothetical protein